MLRQMRSNALYLGVCAAGLLAVSTGYAAQTVVTDPSSINVCERVPGAEVAKVLGKPLKSERPIVFKDSKLSRCVYLLYSGGKPEGADARASCSGSTRRRSTRSSTRSPRAKLEPVSGVGDEAVRFLDTGDGRHKLRALRKGRYAVEATAGDAASALALAKLAVERFDK